MLFGNTLATAVKMVKNESQELHLDVIITAALNDSRFDFSQGNRIRWLTAADFKKTPLDQAQT
jgi:hypothetical protein